MLALFMVVLGITACSDDSATNDAPAGKVSVSVAELAMRGEGDTTTFSVESDSDWTVYSDFDWLTCSQTSALAPGGTVTVTAAVNPKEAEREGSVIIKSGSTRVPVKITQAIDPGAPIEIEDPAFAAYLLANCDFDGDGYFRTKEAASITELNISGLGIKSLPELNDYFKQLVRLDCSKNELTELNIANLTKLEYLDCSDNKLETLDIQRQLKLEYMNATGNASLSKIYVWTGFVEKEGFLKPDTAEWVEPEIPTPAGYQLVWSQEFNEEGESTPLTSYWQYETGDGGWGNNELQDYVAGTYNGEKLALVSEGTLKIIAKKIDGKVRSIRMNTKESWTYGYFEARLKLASGKGTWPAFWMMPRNYTSWPEDGEIDIMEEVGYHPNFVSSSIHCLAYYHKVGTQKTHEFELPTAQTEFHTYALEWTKDAIKCSVDGNVHFTFNNDGTGNRDTWPFDDPFYIKLNLAWGGDWGGAEGVDESCLPAVYEIDYVRVFQKIE